MIHLERIKDCKEHTEVAVTLLNKYMDYLYNDVPVTEESHKNFIKSLEGKNEYLWVIKKDEEICGIVSVYHVDTKNRKCEWGRFIVDEKYKGVGSVVEFMVIDFVFNTLKMNKLYCEVMVMNDLTIKLHKKFGFETEGIFVDHVWKKDGFRSVMSLSLNAGQWKAFRGRFAALFSEKAGTIDA